MKKGFFLSLITLVLVVFASVSLLAQIPKTFNYQAYITQLPGESPLNVPVGMTFSLWDNPNIGQGTMKWSAFQNVTPVNGFINVIIDLGSYDLTHEQLYLQVEIGTEVLSRVPLTSVPYAMFAIEADHALTADEATLAHDIDDNIVTSNKILDGTITIDDLSNSVKQIGGDVYGTLPNIYFDGNVIVQKIPAGSITREKLAASVLAGIPQGDAEGEVYGNWKDLRIQNYAVTNIKIAPGAVTGDKIAIGTILGDNIAQGTITGDNIAVGTITSENIQDGTILGGDINQMGATEGNALVWKNGTWQPYAITMQDTYDAGHVITTNDGPIEINGQVAIDGDITATMGQFDDLFVTNSLGVIGDFSAGGDITSLGGIFSGNGSGLTNLPATSLTGIIPEANLPNTIAYKNQANTFTANNIFNGIVTVNNNIAVSGTAAIGGNATIGGTAAIAGATTIGGTVTIDNALNLTPAITLNTDNGHVTATQFNGIFNGNSTSATNLAGGAAGQVPYQSAANTTAFVPVGTTGQILMSNAGAAPAWININDNAALSQIDITNNETPNNLNLTIRDGAVTNEKIAANTITVDKLNSGTVPANYFMKSVGNGTVSWIPENDIAFSLPQNRSYNGNSDYIFRLTQNNNAAISTPRATIEGINEDVQGWAGSFYNTNAQSENAALLASSSSTQDGGYAFEAKRNSAAGQYVAKVWDETGATGRGLLVESQNGTAYPYAITTDADEATVVIKNNNAAANKIALKTFGDIVTPNNVYANTMNVATLNAVNGSFTNLAATNATIDELTINGSIDMTNGYIRNVADPVAAQDAATKIYVDTRDAIVLAAANDYTDTKVTAEENARIAADNLLQGNITAEQNARIAADNVLQGNITAEQNARIAADNVLQANINAETAARIAADNNLQAQIDDLDATKLDFVSHNNTLVGLGTVANPLGINLNNENTWIANQTFTGNVLFNGANNSITVTNNALFNGNVNIPNGDINLQGMLVKDALDIIIWNQDYLLDLTDNHEIRITALEEGLADEIAARIAADALLQGEIDAAEADLAAETAARIAADNTLQGEIDAAEADLAAEIAARIAADNTLQGNIDSEAATRGAADLLLQGNIDTEAATRAAADNTLQGNIDSEAATRGAADLLLQGNIDTEAATRAAADADLDARVSANEDDIDNIYLHWLNDLTIFGGDVEGPFDDLQLMAGVVGNTEIANAAVFGHFSTVSDPGFNITNADNGVQFVAGNAGTQITLDNTAGMHKVIISAGDNWGTQSVLHNNTLAGDGTLAQPLYVNFVPINTIEPSGVNRRYLQTDQNGNVVWGGFATSADFEGNGFEGNPLRFADNFNFTHVSDGVGSFDVTSANRNLIFTGFVNVDAANHEVEILGDGWGAATVQHDNTLIGGGVAGDLLALNLNNSNNWIADQTFSNTVNVNGAFNVGNLPATFNGIVNVPNGEVTIQGTDVKANIDLLWINQVDAWNEIADLDTRMDIAEFDIDDLQADLAAEIAARQANDLALNQAIIDEQTERTFADEALQANIDAEAAAREAADDLLTQAIADEAQDREAADDLLTQAIADEAAAREAADDLLTQAIADEAAAREAADDIINDRIDQEILNRIDGDAQTLADAMDYTDDEIAALLAGPNTWASTQTFDGAGLGINVSNNAQIGNNLNVINNASFNSNVVKILNGDITISDLDPMGTGSPVEINVGAFVVMHDFLLSNFVLFRDDPFGLSGGDISGTYDNLELNSIIAAGSVGSGSQLTGLFNIPIIDFDSKGRIVGTSTIQLNNTLQGAYDNSNPEAAIVVEDAKPLALFANAGQNALTIEGNATVTGDASFTGAFDVLGNVSVDGQLSVTDDVLFDGHLLANGMVDYNTTWTNALGEPDAPIGVPQTTLTPKGYVDAIAANLASLIDDNIFSGENTFGAFDSPITAVHAYNDSYLNPTVEIKNFHNIPGEVSVALQVSGYEGTTAIDVPTGDVNISAGRLMVNASSNDQALVYLTNNGSQPALQIDNGGVVLSHVVIPAPGGAILDLSTYASKSVITIDGLGSFTVSNLLMPPGIPGQILNVVRINAAGGDVMTIAGTTLTGNGVAQFVYVESLTAVGSWVRIK